jgi:hypothetical protein
VSDAGEILQQAAEAAEAVLAEMLRKPNARPCSATVLPPSEEAPKLIMTIPMPPETRFPLDEIVVARLTYALGNGCAVRIITTNETILRRAVAVLEMIAGTATSAGSAQ